MRAAFPENETARIAALRRNGILDSDPEPEYDELVQIASAICETPFALLNFVDADRQFGKAMLGLDSNMPRDVAFCAHTILGEEVLEICDTREDERFSANPIVKGDPHIRFYAGAPVVDDDGFALGSICVLDTTPRTLTAEQRDALRLLARQAGTQLALRHALRETRDLSDLVQLSHDAVIVRDLDGTIRSWNDGAVRIYGLAGDEAVGKRTHDILATTFPEPLEQIDAELVETGRWEGELVHRGRDGDRREVESRWVLHGATAVLEINRDVTVRREAERALEEQNRRLIELDTLKDEFVALVSHELRTPLTTINGFVELLLADADTLSSDQRLYLDHVQSSSARLVRIVSDLLVLAKAGTSGIPVDRKPIDLVELVTRAVAAWKPVADRSEVALTLEADAVATIEADHDRLTQSLDNLIGNAIKFSRAGGRVEVRVRQADAGARIAIADSGIGIPADELGQLFQRFFRASSATERGVAGTGLGLAISRAIVESHGGSIEVESELDAGTTFTIVLPR